MAATEFELQGELEEEFLEAAYGPSFESELLLREFEAPHIPPGRCTPVGKRVGNFTCSNAEIAAIRAFLKWPTVTAPTLRAAVEAAAGQAVSLATRAADALDRSRRTDKTRRIFCEAFGVTPEFVPPWRASLHGVVRWRDLGELVAIRLRDAAHILDGGCIHYFCWGTVDRCPESSTPPEAKYASSSFLGRYIICLGGLFWQRWQSGDAATTASTLLHEALHIYFRTTVAHSGRSGNANCYERFAVRLQDLPLHPDTAAGCTAGSCRSPALRRHMETSHDREYDLELEGEAAELELAFPPRPTQYRASVTRALNSGSESAAVKLAVASGQRDERALTNLVFFARHPERQGRELQRSERGYKQLYKEWTDIRRRVVCPVLAAPGASRLRPGTVGKAWARKLVPLLNLYRREIPEVPLEFLIGWIAFESGGNICSLTGLDERGYFQLHPDQSKDLRLYERFGKRHEELSYDPDFSIKAGILLVRSFMDHVRRLGYQPGTDLFWRLVKWHHWLPRGIKVILAHMKQNGFRASNWEEFRKYVLDRRSQFLRLIPGAKPETGWDPKAGIQSVDRVFELGREFLPAATSREFELEARVS
jgi:hypothetical protein